MKNYKHIALAAAVAIWGLPHSPLAQEVPSHAAERLQHLADKQELYELNARYARAVDRKNFSQLTELYDPNGVHDHGGMFKGAPDAFIQWLSQSMTEIETQHFIGNSLFHINGDTATGEVYTINFHHLNKRAVNYIAGGRYLDQYVKLDGKWRFKSRLRVIDWSEERPATPGETSASLLRGKNGRADPSAYFWGFTLTN